MNVISATGPGGRILRFLGHADVYPVNRYQSLWLASTAYYETTVYCTETGLSPPQLQAWEPCCGGAPGAIFLKAANIGYVRASDVNPNALRAARLNASHNGIVLDDISDIHYVDDSSGRMFDILVCNPPCRPTEMLSPGLNATLRLAIDGGPGGVAPYQKLIREARSRLLPGGRLIFVLVSTSDFLTVVNELNTTFPGMWRMSLDSPVAQPFLGGGIGDGEPLLRLRDPRRTVAWLGRNGTMWRLSWIIVATNGVASQSAVGNLSFRNHSFDIANPRFDDAIAFFESSRSPVG